MLVSNFEHQVMFWEGKLRKHLRMAANEELVVCTFVLQINREVPDVYLNMLALSGWASSGNTCVVLKGFCDNMHLCT